MVEVTYVGRGGTHVLGIDAPDHADFRLAVNTDEVATDVLELEPGTYTVFCAIPGHAEAGMRATLHVTGP